MNRMRTWLPIGLALCCWAPAASAAYVVSNAMSHQVYSNLAAAAAASANNDRLVMIGDETLFATLNMPNHSLTIVSDGNVRTIRGSTNCAYDMIMVAGTNATLTLGAPGGSDAAPTLVFDGGRFAGVSNLYDMFYLDLGWLNIHPGVVLRNLASLDTGPIHNKAGVVDMFGGRIESNLAPYGGGIFNDIGEVRIQGGSITGNTANVGGGIYNQAVLYYQGFINGYLGKLTMGRGEVSGNAAAQAGGGLYNLGAAELSGGSIERNSANYGGGVLQDNGSSTNGMILRGSVVVSGNVAAVAGRGVYYNNDSFTWLTLAEGARVDPSNDVYMASNINPLVLSGPLSGRGAAAQVTPSTYSTNFQVLGVASASNLWVVSNYYGKFTVTPEGGTNRAWYVGSDGRLTHDNPGLQPPEISSFAATASALELGIDPAYVAWDGTVDFATNLAGRGWNFQPLPTNLMAVTNGRVVVVPQVPAAVYRVRR